MRLPVGVFCRTTAKIGRQHQERHDGPGYLGARQVVDAEVDDRGRQDVDRAGAEQDVADAAIERHGAERHHQRLQSQARDQIAVEGAEQAAKDKRQRDCRQRRHASLDEQAEDHGRQRQHRGDRQVDLAGDDEQCHRQDQQRLFRRARGQLRQIEAGNEIRHEDRRVEEDGQARGRQQQVPEVDRTKEFSHLALASLACSARRTMKVSMPMATRITRP